MKILHRKDWTHEFTCERCGSALAAESGDVKVGYLDSDFTGPGPLLPYVNCPVCGTLHELGVGDVPEELLDGLREAKRTRRGTR